jgi:hypothetical protein
VRGKPKAVAPISVTSAMEMVFVVLVQQASTLKRITKLAKKCVRTQQYARGHAIVIGTIRNLVVPFDASIHANALAVTSAMKKRDIVRNH